MKSTAATPDWLTHEIKTGLQSLLCLSLEGQPAVEIVPGTMLAWSRAICHRRQFDQDRDAPRFREAFAILAATRRRWPAPVDLLDAMPRIVDHASTLRMASDASRKRGLHAIRDLASELHVELNPRGEMRMEERK